MNTRLALLTLVGATCFSTAHAEAPSPGAPEDVRAAIHRIAESFEVPGIAVAAIRDGEVAWIEAHGNATDDRAVGENTTFNVASLTKPLFATMVMHLVAADRFDLDGPLAKHWVDPDVADDPRHEKLTARLALSHQSGLPNWRGRNSLSFQFAPGARHEYSGEGFEYVRRAVELSTGESMADLMATYVLESAAMDATRFGWSDELKSSIVTGYREDGSALPHAVWQGRPPNAAANTFTTVDDLARFAAWVARGADLPVATFVQMCTPQAVHEDPLESFALGWRAVSVNEHDVIMHDGREDGLRTLLVVDTTSRNGLVVLTNSSNGELVTRDLIAATLDNGRALNEEVDRDVWRFITGQPPQMQAGMLSFIARSPTFSAKLLQAVQTTLVHTSALPARELERSSRLAGDVIGAHFEGALDADALAGQFALLDGDPGEAVVLNRTLDTSRAQTWVDGLDALMNRSNSMETRHDN